jgi:hypothetical protein
MSFADTFELPVARKVGDKTYMLPVLTTRDYLPWIAEETQAMRAEAHALIPEKIKPNDLLAARKQASRIECTTDEIARQVRFRPAAVIRVLEIAARKAGVADDDIAAFVDAGNERRNRRDAARVSGLFSAAEQVDLFPEDVPSWVMRLIDAAQSGDATAVTSLVKGISARPSPEPAELTEKPDAVDPETGLPNG